MATREKMRIHGAGEVSNMDAAARPAPIELPAWKEMDTTKILPPTRALTNFPYRCLMVSMRVVLLKKPYRAVMVVKTIIKTVDKAITHIKLY